MQFILNFSPVSESERNRSFADVNVILTTRCAGLRGDVVPQSDLETAAPTRQNRSFGVSGSREEGSADRGAQILARSLRAGI